jgi:hypothetical protein
MRAHHCSRRWEILLYGIVFGFMIGIFVMKIGA